MSYSKQQRATIARPQTATDSVCQATEAKLVEHYVPILTPELMIAHRKGAYATVINSTIDGQNLTDLVGTVVAKEMTEAVLTKVSAKFSAVVTK